VREPLIRQIEIEEMEELLRDEHEIFDDYMEMVVTFGYITMFASVFVLGAPIIFVFILLETRSDIFKLERTMKRPIPSKTFNIGSWALIVEIFCILSIFSNIIVCCFASNQIDNLFPWLSAYRDDPSTSLTTVFSLEHLLLFGIFILKLVRDRNPKWVSIYLARRVWRQDLSRQRLAELEDDE
jgi:anoctamin-10